MNADKRKGVFGAAVVLWAAVAAGCGEGDRLSRREFVREATAICRPVERELEALPQPQSLPELETYAQQANELTEDGVERLRELRPPEELEDAYDRYLDRAEQVVDLLDELEAAAADGDTAETTRLLREISTAAESRELAEAAGIGDACEQDVEP